MKAAAVRLLQQKLIDEGYVLGKVDGKLGKKTYAAVESRLEKNTDQLPTAWKDWPSRRKCIALLQILCKKQNIDIGVIDGQWGPQTEYGFDLLAYYQKHSEFPPLFRNQIPLDINPSHWPDQSEAELIRFYGERGENQTRLVLPYPHRLSWDLRKTVNSFFCHEKIHDSAQRVLKRVLEHYGPDRIKELRLDRWGGCLNVRKMRGGTKWSMHSWGIAVDYDTQFNKYSWGRDRATLAKPEYESWWLCRT